MKVYDEYSDEQGTVFVVFIVFLVGAMVGMLIFATIGHFTSLEDRTASCEIGMNGTFVSRQCYSNDHTFKDPCLYDKCILQDGQVIYFNGEMSP